MFNILLVAIGGSLGACLRHFFYLFFKNYFFQNYLFINTLIVNIIGSFFIGYIIMLMGTKNISQEFIKYFFIIGFLGSFTTFSAFSIETIDMFKNGKIFMSFTYIFLSIFLSIFAAYIGISYNKF